MNQYVEFFRKRIIDAYFKNPVAKVATTLPTRKGAAVASVLADLLSGGVLNGVDMADEIHSSRLKDHISTLRHRHGWTTIESSQIAKATKDGRVQWVKQYWLPIETLDGLDQKVVNAWVAEVRHIRAEKRIAYEQAQRRSIAANARKREQRWQAAGYKA